MESTLRFIYIVSGIFSFALLILVTWLFKHEKMRKQEFFLWLCISVAMLFISVMPSILVIIASLLGIAYTYVAIIVIGFPMFLFVFLYLFTQLYDVNRRLAKLAQRLAILEQNLNDINDKKKTKNHN